MRAAVGPIGAVALALFAAGCAAEMADPDNHSAPALDKASAEPSCRRDYAAAGILPYTIRNGRVLVLLGEESRTEGIVWTDFIGTRKDPDCEPVVTAAREFREETRNAYPDAATVAYIRERRPLTIDPPGVHFWIMPVDYVDALELRNGPTGRWSEKFTYCWVDLAGLLRAVDENTQRIPEDCGGRSKRLFTKFENNLREGGVSRNALEELLATHAQP
jgi:8-oxo-dGTP pyrophosphatase MutT (NUDIX family)